MTRLTRAVPEHLREGRKLIGICTFACKSVPQVMMRGLPYIGLCLALLLLGFLASAFKSTAYLGLALKVLAIGPAILAAYWIQWQAVTHVGSDTEFETRWLVLPPRRWAEKTLPLVFILGAGLILLMPFGKGMWPDTTFGMVVWPMLMTTAAMFALLAATGIGSVGAAQEIDADMAGYSGAGGQVFLISGVLCLISFTVITVLLGPAMFLIAVTLGVAEGWTVPFLMTGQIIFVWTAGSIALAFLLEDRLWHTEFYN